MGVVVEIGPVIEAESGAASSAGVHATTDAAAKSARLRTVKDEEEAEEGGREIDMRV